MSSKKVKGNPKPKKWATPVKDFVTYRDGFIKDRLWTYNHLTGLTTILDGIKMTAEEFDKTFSCNSPTNFYSNPENPNVKNNFTV